MSNIFYTDAYGSVGDGVADDTIAINLALTAARTSGVSKAVVVIPPGDYKITDTLLWGSNITIMAHGAFVFNGTLHGFYMLNGYDSSAPHAPDYDSGYSNISLYGGTWDAKAYNVSADDSYNIITLSSGRGVVIRDAVFRNVASYHAIDANSIDGLLVDGCRFEGFRDTTSDHSRFWSEAVQLDQGPDGAPCINVKITNNYTGVSPWSGLGVFGKLVGSHTDTVGQSYSNIIVSHNLINGCGDVGIRASSWSNSVISSNVIRNAASDGIKLWQAVPQLAQRITVADNTIVNPSARGIYVSGASDATWDSVTIEGNTINGSDLTGIEASNMNNSTIEGNTIGSSTVHGILVHACIDNAINGNTINTPAVTGVQVDAGSGNHVSGNRIKSPGERGVWLANSTVKNAVTSNLISGTGRLTPACAGIEVSGSANNDNTITGNVVQKKGSGTESTYAVVVAGTTPARNVFLFNVYRGWVTPYNLNGNTACVFAVPGVSSVNGVTT